MSVVSESCAFISSPAITLTSSTMIFRFHECSEDVPELGGVDAAVAVLVELAEGIVVLADVA